MFCDFICNLLQHWRNKRFFDCCVFSPTCCLFAAGCLLGATSWTAGSSWILTLLFIISGIVASIISYYRKSKIISKMRDKLFLISSKKNEGELAKFCKQSVKISYGTFDYNINTDIYPHFKIDTQYLQTKSLSDNKSSLHQEDNGNIQIQGEEICNECDSSHNVVLCHEQYVTGPVPGGSQNKKEKGKKSPTKKFPSFFSAFGQFSQFKHQISLTEFDRNVSDEGSSGVIASTASLESISEENSRKNNIMRSNILDEYEALADDSTFSSLNERMYENVLPQRHKIPHDVDRLSRKGIDQSVQEIYIDNTSRTFPRCIATEFPSPSPYVNIPQRELDKMCDPINLEQSSSSNLEKSFYIRPKLPLSTEKQYRKNKIMEEPDVHRMESYEIATQSSGRQITSCSSNPYINIPSSVERKHLQIQHSKTNREIYSPSKTDKISTTIGRLPLSAEQFHKANILEDVYVMEKNKIATQSSEREFPSCSQSSYVNIPSSVERKHLKIQHTETNLELRYPSKIDKTSPVRGIISLSPNQHHKRNILERTDVHRRGNDKIAIQSARRPFTSCTQSPYVNIPSSIERKHLQIQDAENNFELKCPSKTDKTPPAASKIPETHYERKILEAADVHRTERDKRPIPSGRQFTSFSQNPYVNIPSSVERKHEQIRHAETNPELHSPSKTDETSSFTVRSSLSPEKHRKIGQILYEPDFYSMDKDIDTKAGRLSKHSGVHSSRFLNIPPLGERKQQNLQIGHAESIFERPSSTTTDKSFVITERFSPVKQRPKNKTAEQVIHKTKGDGLIGSESSKKHLTPERPDANISPFRDLKKYLLRVFDAAAYLEKRDQSKREISSDKIERESFKKDEETGNVKKYWRGKKGKQSTKQSKQKSLSVKGSPSMTDLEPNSSVLQSNQIDTYNVSSLKFQRVAASEYGEYSNGKAKVLSPCGEGSRNTGKRVEEENEIGTQSDKIQIRRTGPPQKSYIKSQSLNVQYTKSFKVNTPIQREYSNPIYEMVKSVIPKRSLEQEKTSQRYSRTREVTDVSRSSSGEPIGECSKSMKDDIHEPVSPESINPIYQNLVSTEKHTLELGKLSESCTGTEKDSNKSSSKGILECFSNLPNLRESPQEYSAASSKIVECIESAVPATENECFSSSEQEKSLSYQEKSVATMPQNYPRYYRNILPKHHSPTPNINDIAVSYSIDLEEKPQDSPYKTKKCTAAPNILSEYTFTDVHDITKLQRRYPENVFSPHTSPRKVASPIPLPRKNLPLGNQLSNPTLSPKLFLPARTTKIDLPVFRNTSNLLSTGLNSKSQNILEKSVSMKELDLSMTEINVQFPTPDTFILPPTTNSNVGTSECRTKSGCSFLPKTSCKQPSHRTLSPQRSTETSGILQRTRLSTEEEINICEVLHPTPLTSSSIILSTQSPPKRSETMFGPKSSLSIPRKSSPCEIIQSPPKTTLIVPEPAITQPTLQTLSLEQFPEATGGLPQTGLTNEQEKRDSKYVHPDTMSLFSRRISPLQSPEKISHSMFCSKSILSPTKSGLSSDLIQSSTKLFGTGFEDSIRLQTLSLQKSAEASCALPKTEFITKEETKTSKSFVLPDTPLTLSRNKLPSQSPLERSEQMPCSPKFIPSPQSSRSSHELNKSPSKCIPSVIPQPSATPQTFHTVPLQRYFGATCGLPETSKFIIPDIIPSLPRLPSPLKSREKSSQPPLRSKSIQSIPKASSSSEINQSPTKCIGTAFEISTKKPRHRTWSLQQSIESIPGLPKTELSTEARIRTSKSVFLPHTQLTFSRLPPKSSEVGSETMLRPKYNPSPQIASSSSERKIKRPAKNTSLIHPQLPPTQPSLHTRSQQQSAETTSRIPKVELTEEQSTKRYVVLPDTPMMLSRLAPQSPAKHSETMLQPERHLSPPPTSSSSKTINRSPTKTIGPSLSQHSPTQFRFCSVSPLQPTEATYRLPTAVLTSEQGTKTCSLPDTSFTLSETRSSPQSPRRRHPSDEAE